MSDLTLIAEYIRDALQSLEQTQERGSNLRERVTRENYAQFRFQMNELFERLRLLNAMLRHEDEMALDELAAALDRAFEKQPSEYRHAIGHGK